MPTYSNLHSVPMTEVREAVLFHLLTESKFKASGYAVPNQPIVKTVSRILGVRESKRAPKINEYDLFGFDVLDGSWLDTLDQTFDILDKPCPVSVVLAQLLDEGHIKFLPAGYGISLTGISEAVDNIGLLAPARNSTTVFLQGFLTPDTVRLLKNHIAIKCSRSVALDEVSDLIGNYFAKLMELDSLAKFLRLGQPPAISSLKLWVYRRALSTFRNEGRDALTRTVKGARTEQDLTGESLSVQADGDSNLTPIYLTEGDDDLLSGNDAALLDVADFSHIPSTEGIEQARTYAVIERVFRERKPEQANRLFRVFKLAAEGMQIQDIAVTENLSRNSAAVYLAEVKSIVIAISTVGSRARQVLEYLGSEPCASSSDIMSDMGMDFVPVLDQLVHAGWAFKVTESGDCYQITDAGERLLDSTKAGAGYDAVAIFSEL